MAKIRFLEIMRRAKEAYGIANIWELRAWVQEYCDVTAEDMTAHQYDWYQWAVWAGLTE